MVDGGPPAPAARGSALGLRLALAFISVALAAVALLAGLTAGFGLAVAAELTRAHGGQLSAASRPGQGTQMTLTLPRA
jgi:signal transduction histidine kinase